MNTNALYRVTLGTITLCAVRRYEADIVADDGREGQSAGRLELVDRVASIPRNAAIARIYLSEAGLRYLISSIDNTLDILFCGGFQDTDAQGAARTRCLKKFLAALQATLKGEA